MISSNFSILARRGISHVFSLLLFSLLLASCGSDGDTGPVGPPGPPGPPAPAPGVDISNASNMIAEIISVTVGDQTDMHFTLTDGDGNPVTNLPDTSLDLTIAKLTPGTDGNASAWQNYINVIEDPIPGPGGGSVPGSESQGWTEHATEGTLVENFNGDYTYTYAIDITNVTEPFPVSHDPNLTHRAGFEIRGFGPVDNPTYTFRPADNATEGLFSRTMVKTETCNNCHEKGSHHGFARFEVDYCQTCHNPGSADGNTGNSLDLKVMIHKIHRGEDLPSVVAGDDYCIRDFSGILVCFGDVAFPQDIRNCETCHDEGDPETPDAANWYQMPTTQACGSCHDNLDFETGANHPGGPQSNGACTSCHVPDKNNYNGAYQQHRILPDEDAAKYSLNILAIDFLGPGTAPMVTFSVTDPTNGDMPYDLANDPNLTNGTSSLTFYTAWNTTDYENAGSYNSGATGVLVYSGGVLQATDNGDFTYSLSTALVPATAQGSGGIAFAGQIQTSVGQVRPDNTHSFFGITDDPANPVERRSNVVDIDRCDVCHNRLKMHNDRTENTNVCVMCHNPGATFGPDRPMDMKSFIHRIHAVDGIRYPQRVSNCVACHTKNGFYPVELADGVHATSTNIGIDASDPTDNTRTSANAAACSVCHSSADTKAHMSQNGASFDACQETDGTLRIRLDFCGVGGNKNGAVVEEGCTVCHGPGKTADVAVSHGIESD